MSLLPYALTRPLLFRLDAERAHELTLASMARLQGTLPRGLPLAQPAGVAAERDDFHQRVGDRRIFAANWARTMCCN